MKYWLQKAIQQSQNLKNAISLSKIGQAILSEIMPAFII